MMPAAFGTKHQRNTSCRSDHRLHNLQIVFVLTFLLCSSFCAIVAVQASSTSSPRPPSTTFLTKATTTRMTYPKIKLTYFDIEGVAEPVRLALALSGIEYEDHRIAFQDWPAMKPTTPHGTLPIMIVDGDEANPRVQSGAMLRYVATLNPSANLYPHDKLLEIEESMGIVGDFVRAWSPCLYLGMRPQNFGYPEGYNNTPEGKELIKSMRLKFVETELPKYLKYFADYIDKHGNGKFLCGDTPTIADCLAVPTLRGFTRGHIDHVPTDCLNVEPRIVEYIQRFVAVDAIKGRYNDGIH